MKLLHITPAYVPAFRHGGPILSVHALNKALVAQGVDVTVYTTNINGPETLSVPTSVPQMIDGVCVVYFASSFPRAWEYSRDLHRALRDTVKDFDLVHITSVFRAASTLGACYAKKYKKPYIISPRGTLMKEPLALKSSFKKHFYLNLIEKRNLRDASAIHFTAQNELDEYNAAGLPLKKAILIPNSFDMVSIPKDATLGEFRKKYGIDEKRKIILSLGRLSWKKGFDTLIPAFKGVLGVESTALLVIAGNDDEGYKATIQKLIEENKIPKKSYLFTDMLLGREKEEVFLDANVFVLPSYSENFGMAPVEAMVHGTATIITRDVGISPYVVKAGGGIVIEKDVETLKEKMLYVLKNPNEAKEIGKRGKAMVGQEFSPEKVAKQFVEEYNSLIKK